VFIDLHKTIGFRLVPVLLIKQDMEFVIIWKTLNQFLAGLDLMVGLYLLSLAGMLFGVYLKRLLND
jgi:hypothetical protein